DLRAVLGEFLGQLRPRRAGGDTRVHQPPDDGRAGYPVRPRDRAQGVTGAVAARDGLGQQQRPGGGVAVAAAHRPPRSAALVALSSFFFLTFSLRSAVLPGGPPLPSPGGFCAGVSACAPEEVATEISSVGAIRGPSSRSAVSTGTDTRAAENRSRCELELWSVQASSWTR